MISNSKNPHMPGSDFLKHQLFECCLIGNTRSESQKKCHMFHLTWIQVSWYSHNSPQHPQPLSLLGFPRSVPQGHDPGGIAKPKGQGVWAVNCTIMWVMKKYDEMILKNKTDIPWGYVIYNIMFECQIITIKVHAYWIIYIHKWVVGGVIYLSVFHTL